MTTTTTTCTFVCVKNNAHSLYCLAGLLACLPGRVPMPLFGATDPHALH